MPSLLLRLNGAPEDEVQEIRTLLDAHAIDYYETEAGRWGISLAAIWLPDGSMQEARARSLIETYQTERQQRARSQRTAETWIDRSLRQPLRFAAFAVAILAVLYFSLMPFLRWS
jgi:hypothetical protein